MSTFKPGAKYNWKPDSQITITGEQFEILYNNLSRFMVADLSPLSIISVAEAHTVVFNILAQMVENGLATEATNPLPGYLQDSDAQ